MSSHSDGRSLLRRQSGTIGRRQALGVGLSRHQIAQLVSSGAWTRLLPGVYLTSDAPLTWHAWAFAAVLAAGTDAALVGATAAALRQWTPCTLPIQVAVPRCRRVRLTTSAIEVLRLDVPGDDRVTVAGLPTTTRLRTAVDVAHLMPLLAAQQVLDRMLVLGVVELGALADAVAASRRAGSRQARRLLRSASDLTAAESERLALRLFRDAGITGWTPNHPVTASGRTLKVDLALVRLKIAVEIKGWAFHAAPDRAAADDARISDLQLAGWIVLPFGWHELMASPESVVAAVRAAIRLREASAT